MNKQSIISIYKSTIFFTLFIFLTILSNLVYFYFVIKNTNIYKNQKQFEENNNTNLKTVFFGDSLPALGVNPEFFPDSFNYAVPSERLDQTYYKVKKTLEENTHIKTIVLPLDLHTFSRPADPGRYHYIWYWSNIIPSNELQNLTGKTETKLLINKYMPFIESGKDFITIFSQKRRTEMHKGWQKEMKTVDIMPPVKNDKATNEKIVINDDLFNYFIDIIKMAENKNINVVLVRYPNLVRSPMYQNKKEINVYYDKIYEKISLYKNVSSLNCWQSLTNPAFFSDYQHLNNLGAEIFSKMLYSDFKMRKFINEESSFSTAQQMTGKKD